jgi:hypothetical protein
MKLTHDGRIEFGTRDCHSCGGRGTQPTRIPCPPCKGTGRGKRGGVGGCRPCHGMGKDWDFKNTQVCGACHGSKNRLETDCDYAPREIWESLAADPVTIDSPREQDHGCLFEGRRPKLSPGRRSRRVYSAAAEERVCRAGDHCPQRGSDQRGTVPCPADRGARSRRFVGPRALRFVSNSIFYGGHARSKQCPDIQSWQRRPDASGPVRKGARP